MKQRSHDIVIKIHLENKDGLHSKELLQVLDTLETSLYASDRQDIERASEELKIPAVIRDASLERLRKYRNDRLLLTGANNGSIELFGVVAGVSYFVLDKVIGEAFKQGVKETEFYRDLKEFFRQTIDDKALYIGENLRRVFANKKKQAIVKTIQANDTEPNHIIVDIHGRLIKKEDRVLSLGEELDKRDRN